jgi:TP901 family phage tail tape measure protein
VSRNYGGTMVANLFVKFGADTEEYQKKMRAAVTRMLFAAESLTQAGRIMSTAITAPMLLVGAASLKTAMQFEDAMTRMVSLVGMPAETIARWGPVVQDMAGIVGKSANELAEALFFITSNGIRTDQALRVLEATAKASAVGMGETKDIAIAATSALNAFGEGALTADEAVAVLIGTVREGNLEAAELPAALAKLLPVAAALGVEFHEAGAGIAAMSRSGTSARLAAFGLRAIMMGILDPTISARKAMDDVGLSAATLQRTLAGPNGLRIALLQIAEATKTGDTTLKDILPNQKAFVAALQLIGKSTEDYVEISENMAKVVGEDVNDAFEKGAKTMKRTYDQAMGKLSSAAIDLGNNLAPVIDKFGELATKASGTARGFNELDDYWKGLISTAALSLAALGPFLYALGSIARVTARFTGLSILLKLAWVKNAAEIVKNTQAIGGLSASMKKFNVSATQLAGSVVLVGVAGYQFGKWLDHVTGLTEALNREFGTFGKASRTVAEGLKTDSQITRNYSNASENLAMAIGEVNLAHDIAAARKAKDLGRLAELMQSVEELAAAYNAARIQANGLTQDQENVADTAQVLADAAAEIAEEEGERLKKLREAHGLMTSDEVTQKMDEITNRYKDHINEGVSRNRVNKEMLTDVEETAEWMREYGIAASDAFKEVARSMNETGDLTNNEFYQLFNYYIPQAINAIPGKVIEGMVEIEGAVAGSLKGGLDRGFAEGLNEFTTTMKPQLEAALNTTWQGGFKGFGDTLRDQINDLVAQISPLQIDVVPNPQVFADALRDIQDNNPPDTRG